MKGKLFQILDVDGDPEGLYYTEDTISDYTIKTWWDAFRETESYEVEGPDAFEEFIQENFNGSIERVYVENIIPKDYE